MCVGWTLRVRGTYCCARVAKKIANYLALLSIYFSVPDTIRDTNTRVRYEDAKRHQLPRATNWSTYLRECCVRTGVRSFFSSRFCGTGRLPIPNIKEGFFRKDLVDSFPEIWFSVSAPLATVDSRKRALKNDRPHVRAQRYLFTVCRQLP